MCSLVDECKGLSVVYMYMYSVERFIVHISCMARVSGQVMVIYKDYKHVHLLTPAVHCTREVCIFITDTVDVSDHDTIGDSDGVKVEGGEEVEKEGEEEGGGEEGEVVGEKIDNEGRGTQKEENESVEDSCLTDPLTA